MNIPEHDVLFQYNGKATQPVGAPATMGINMTMPGTVRWELSYIRIGNDNYAAGRLIDPYIIDASTNVVIKLGSVTIDNLKHTVPALKTMSDDNVEQDSTLGIPPKALFGSTHGISVRGTSLVDAEVITIEAVIRMMGIVGAFPIITVLGAGVTLSAETKALI